MLIGEVAERSGVSARMLRHYETLGLVVASGRTDGGYRDYSEVDLRRLFQVEALRSLGMSLAEVRQALEDTVGSAESLLAALVAQARDRIAEETSKLERLSAIDVSAPLDWATVVRTVRLGRDLASEQPALRQRAALAADGRIPTSHLVRTYSSEADPNTAGALRWALSRRADAVAALAPELQSPEPEVRARAVLALAAIPGDDTGPLLRSALADADGDVRRHAAMAVGARGGLEAVPALVELVLAGHRDVEAAERLGAISAHAGGLDAVLGALTRALDDPAADAAARHRVVQALGELGDGEVRLLLERLID
ncbi:MAG: MerR family transcriptional regulator, partial [Amnibacterium sp.]